MHTFANIVSSHHHTIIALRRRGGVMMMSGKGLPIVIAIFELDYESQAQRGRQGVTCYCQHITTTHRKGVEQMQWVECT